jgi:hypothetical protein
MMATAILEIDRRENSRTSYVRRSPEILMLIRIWRKISVNLKYSGPWGMSRQKSDLFSHFGYAEHSHRPKH